VTRLGGRIDRPRVSPETSSGRFIPAVTIVSSMREDQEEASEEEFDLWKLDRNAQEETHQAEFALK
jgi:hypothetical protein